MKDMTMELREELLKTKEVAEELDPTVEQRIWRIAGYDTNGTHFEGTYIQAPLGFFPAQKLGVVLGGYIEQFIEGELGSLRQILGSGDFRAQLMPDEATPEAAEKAITENADLIKAIIHAVQAIPELQVEIMKLALGVPGGQQKWFGDVVQLAPHLGGMTPDQGADILVLFIKQNAGELKRFFSERGQELVNTFREEVLGHDLTEEATDTDLSPSEPSDSPESETPTHLLSETEGEEPNGGMPSSTSSQAIRESV